MIKTVLFKPFLMEKKYKLLVNNVKDFKFHLISH